MTHEPPTVKPGPVGPGSDRYPELYTGWPVDRPIPTEVAFAAAKERWFTEGREVYSTTNYQGDFYFMFEFTMQTYNPLMWLGYFFPDDLEKFRQEFGRLIADGKVQK